MLPPLGVPHMVHITSVVAALHKLNVEIPVEDLIKAIHVEEDAKRVQERVDFTAEATQYLAMLSKLGLQTSEAPASLDLSTVSESVPDPTKPANVEPLSKQERRRRLIELAKQRPPESKFLNPFAKYSIAAPGRTHQENSNLIDTS